MASEATNIIERGQTAFIVKWVASIIQLLGYAGAGFGWTPCNRHLFLVGVLGWLIVGVPWTDKAIMLIHLVALGSMLAGMASQFRETAQCGHLPAAVTRYEARITSAGPIPANRTSSHLM